MNRFEYFQFERILRKINCVAPHHRGYKCVPLKSHTECQKCEAEERRKDKNELSRSE